MTRCVRRRGVRDDDDAVRPRHASRGVRPRLAQTAVARALGRARASPCARERGARTRPLRAYRPQLTEPVRTRPLRAQSVELAPARAHVAVARALGLARTHSCARGRGARCGRARAHSAVARASRPSHVRTCARALVRGSLAFALPRATSRYLALPRATSPALALARQKLAGTRARSRALACPRARSRALVRGSR